MPDYVYGCTNKNHPRVEVTHGINDSYLERCKVCGNYLHRIPQPFRFGFSPIEIIRDWSERNWSKYLRKEPRDYKNVSTQRGLPQKDYGARK
jgi:hypothetical protein